MGYRSGDTPADLIVLPPAALRPPPNANPVTAGPCVECHTEGGYDQQFQWMRLCFWCAELQRIHPHPTQTLSTSRR